MNAEPSSNPHSAAITRRTTPEVEEAVEGHSYPPLHPASSTSFLIAEAETSRPLLLVKLTGFRLLTTAIIVTVGTVKAMASLKGAAVTATALEWVMGVVLGTTLYWLGLYESLQPPVAVWFFHEDYTLDLLYLPCTGVVAAILALGVALFLYLYIFTPLSAYMLISTKLFPDEEWAGLILGPLVFLVVCLLLVITASCAVLSLNYILPLIGRLILRLGGRRFKASVGVVVDGYFDRYGRHRKSGLRDNDCLLLLSALIYSLSILAVGLYMLLTLFPLILDSTLPSPTIVTPRG